MSILQFPTEEEPGVQNDYSFEMNVKLSSLKVDQLPQTYALVEKLCLPNLSCLYAPLMTISIPDFDFDLLRKALDDEIEWLSQLDINGWSSHHASVNRSEVKEPDITTILPLIREKVHTLDTQYHCMNIISQTINAINPNQTPVDVCDQPVYALT